jgi:hypothetical protein
MPNIGQELATLDFEAMIGGPLIAVVNAQAQSSMATVDFIRAVGFNEDATEPISVSFSFEKPIEKLDAEGEPTGEIEQVKHTLTVPFLTMLPIPTLRIEEATVDFNAKITAVQHRETNSKLGLKSEFSAKAGYGPFSAKLKTSFSYQRSTKTGSKTERTYSMKVHVRAVSDEMPAGTERLLAILENSIKEVKAS